MADPGVGGRDGVAGGAGSEPGEVHHPLVTSMMGPVHGFAYLATIAIAFLLPLVTGTRLLTLVPGVGGLLALRRARGRP